MPEPLIILVRTKDDHRRCAADGLRALGVLIRFSILDGIYNEDEYRSHILHQLERTRRVQTLDRRRLAPFHRGQGLEIGAGIGNLTEQYIPRELYVAWEVNPHYVGYLRADAIGKPYLHVRKIDVTRPADFAGMQDRFDTVVTINILEHVSDPRTALRNVYRALMPGGRAVISCLSIPGCLARSTPPSSTGNATPRRARALDYISGVRRRPRSGLQSHGTARLVVQRTPSEANGVLARAAEGVRRGNPPRPSVDRRLPWSGQSLIAVARRPATSGRHELLEPEVKAR